MTGESSPPFPPLMRTSSLADAKLLCRWRRGRGQCLCIGLRRSRGNRSHRGAMGLNDCQTPHVQKTRLLRGGQPAGEQAAPLRDMVS